MSTPASSSIAKTSRLSSGTSNVPTFSTSSLATYYPFLTKNSSRLPFSVSTALKRNSLKFLRFRSDVVQDVHPRHLPRWRGPAACLHPRQTSPYLRPQFWTLAFPPVADRHI